jgi:hypothetical protein
MDAEQNFAEIEYLERIFEVPDTRPLSQSDLSAANRRLDEKQAHSPWFRLWQRYGVCCRVESPVNCYETLLMMVVHPLRHVKQIEETRAALNKIDGKPD